METTRMPSPDRSETTKRALLYLGITFGLTYAYGFGLLPVLSRAAQTNGAMLAVFQLAFTAVMFFPALGVLFTRLLTREGFSEHFLAPHIKGNAGVYLLAWFGPLVLTIVGAAVWFAVRPDTFDPEMGYLNAQLMGQPLPFSLPAFLAMQGLLVLIAPVLNAVPCFGEEWGWRGYLLPKLQKLMPPIPAVLLSGVIWGLWHAPVIALGHNYGLGYAGAPWSGILMMCVFTTAMGVLLSYVTARTKSCLPAIIGHGMVNGCAALGLMFTQSGGDPFLGPAPTGIVGMSGFVLCAIALLLLWKKRMPAEK